MMIRTLDRRELLRSKMASLHDNGTSQSFPCSVFIFPIKKERLIGIVVDDEETLTVNETVKMYFDTCTALSNGNVGASQVLSSKQFERRISKSSSHIHCLIAIKKAIYFFWLSIDDDNVPLLSI